MRMDRRVLGWAILAVTLTSVTVGCGKKSRSDRDTRREQLRIHAESKRQELVGVDGEYFGRLVQGASAGQSVTLNLQVKDVPTTEEGQIDPVLVPTLTGYLNFNFTSGSLIEAETISFALDKADFDGRSQSMNLNAANSQYKNIVLSLERDIEGNLTGDWTAPDQSASGTVALRKSTASGGTSQLTDYPGYAIRGDYGGLLLWTAAGVFQRARLTISTALAPPDALKMTATVRVFFGDFETAEYRTYLFSEVDYKPITGEVTLKSASSEIVLSGRLEDGRLLGQWSTLTAGGMGGFTFTRELIPPAPVGMAQVQNIRGTLYGKVQSTHPDALFPERMMMSLVTSEDPEQTGSMKISGNVRFYIGPYGSNEYTESPFSHVEYNPYARRLVVSTTGPQELTIKGEMTDSGFVGKLYSGALGEVADLGLIRGIPGPGGGGGGGSTMNGEYRGILEWEDQAAYQSAAITLTSTNDPARGMIISAVAKLVFGDATSNEYLTYQFPNVGYNPSNGLLTIRDDAADVSFAGNLRDDTLSGRWTSRAVGSMGVMTLRRGTPVSIPGGATLVATLAGSYVGRLTNGATSNLPEDVTTTIVTHRDSTKPNGIDLSGTIRFHLDATTYDDHPLTDVNFNFFTRELSAVTTRWPKLTLKAQVIGNSLIGKLYDDALGEVAVVDLNK